VTSYDLTLRITARSIEAESLEDAKRILEDALDAMAGRLPGPGFVAFDINKVVVATEVKE
jgi:hypothetical protein